VPLLEEGLILGIVSFLGWGIIPYIGIRLAFTVLHLIQDRIAHKGRTAYQSMAFPALISILTTLTFVACGATPLAFLISFIIHGVLNNIAGRFFPEYSKGVLGGGGELTPQLSKAIGAMDIPELEGEALPSSVIEEASAEIAMGNRGILTGKVTFLFQADMNSFLDRLLEAGAPEKRDEDEDERKRIDRVMEGGLYRAVLIIDVEKGIAEVHIPINGTLVRFPAAPTFRPGTTRIGDLEIVVDGRNTNFIDYMVETGFAPETFKSCRGRLFIERHIDIGRTRTGEINTTVFTLGGLSFDTITGKITNFFTTPGGTVIHITEDGDIQPAQEGVPSDEEPVLRLHNHGSYNPMPSDQDVKILKRITDDRKLPRFREIIVGEDREGKYSFSAIQVVESRKGKIKAHIEVFDADTGQWQRQEEEINFDDFFLSGLYDKLGWVSWVLFPLHVIYHEVSHIRSALKNNLRITRIHILKGVEIDLNIQALREDLTSRGVAENEDALALGEELIKENLKFAGAGIRASTALAKIAGIIAFITFFTPTNWIFWAAFYVAAGAIIDVAASRMGVDGKRIAEAELLRRELWRLGDRARAKRRKEEQDRFVETEVKPILIGMLSDDLDTRGAAYGQLRLAMIDYSAKEEFGRLYDLLTTPVDIEGERISIARELVRGLRDRDRVPRVLMHSLGALSMVVAACPYIDSRLLHNVLTDMTVVADGRPETALSLLFKLLRDTRDDPETNKDVLARILAILSECDRHVQVQFKPLREAIKYFLEGLPECGREELQGYRDIFVALAGSRKEKIALALGVNIGILVGYLHRGEEHLREYARDLLTSEAFSKSETIISSLGREVPGMAEYASSPNTAATAYTREVLAYMLGSIPGCPGIHAVAERDNGAIAVGLLETFLDEFNREPLRDNKYAIAFENLARTEAGREAIRFFLQISIGGLSETAQQLITRLAAEALAELDEPIDDAPAAHRVLASEPAFDPIRSARINPTETPRLEAIRDVRGTIIGNPSSVRQLMTGEEMDEDDVSRSRATAEFLLEGMVDTNPLVRSAAYDLLETITKSCYITRNTEVLRNLLTESVPIAGRETSVASRLLAGLSDSDDVFVVVPSLVALKYMVMTIPGIRDEDLVRMMAGVTVVVDGRRETALSLLFRLVTDLHVNRGDAKIQEDARNILIALKLLIDEGVDTEIGPLRESVRYLLRKVFSEPTQEGTGELRWTQMQYDRFRELFLAIQGSPKLKDELWEETKAFADYALNNIVITDLHKSAKRPTSTTEAEGSIDLIGKVFDSKKNIATEIVIVKKKGNRLYLKGRSPGEKRFDLFDRNNERIEFVEYGEAADRAEIEEIVRGIEERLATADLSPADRAAAEGILNHLKVILNNNQIYILKRNAHGILGLPDAKNGRIFLDAGLLTPVGLFHEAGEAFLVANPDLVPEGMGVHEYLRGGGMRARLAGGSFTHGLQDRLFGVGENNAFTIQIAKANLDAALAVGDFDRARQIVAERIEASDLDIYAKGMARIKVDQAEREFKRQKVVEKVQRDRARHAEEVRRQISDEGAQVVLDPLLEQGRKMTVRRIKAALYPVKDPGMIDSARIANVRFMQDGVFTGDDLKAPLVGKGIMCELVLEDGTLLHLLLFYDIGGRLARVFIRKHTKWEDEGEHKGIEPLGMEFALISDKALIEDATFNEKQRAAIAAINRRIQSVAASYDMIASRASDKSKAYQVLRPVVHDGHSREYILRILAEYPGLDALHIFMRNCDFPIPECMVYVHHLGHPKSRGMYGGVYVGSAVFTHHKIFPATDFIHETAHAIYGWLTRVLGVVRGVMEVLREDELVYEKHLFFGIRHHFDRSPLHYALARNQQYRDIYEHDEEGNLQLDSEGMPKIKQGNVDRAITEVLAYTLEAILSFAGYVHTLRQFALMRDVQFLAEIGMLPDYFLPADLYPNFAEVADEPVTPENYYFPLIAYLYEHGRQETALAIFNRVVLSGTQLATRALHFLAQRGNTATFEAFLDRALRMEEFQRIRDGKRPYQGSLGDIFQIYEMCAMLKLEDKTSEVWSLFEMAAGHSYAEVMKLISPNLPAVVNWRLVALFLEHAPDWQRRLAISGLLDKTFTSTDSAEQHLASRVLQAIAAGNPDLVMEEPVEGEARRPTSTVTEPPVPEADDLGANDLSHGVYLGRLKRHMIGFLRRNTALSRIPTDASDREVVEKCIEYLEEVGEEEGIALVTEIEDDGHENTIKIINEQAVQTLREGHPARRIVGVMRRQIIERQRGVKAINFKATTGDWWIVGFQEELGTGKPAGMNATQEESLKHEQKEIAFRQRGFKPEEAHEKVDRGENPFKAETAEEIEIAAEARQAQDAQLGAAERGAEDETQGEAEVVDITDEVIALLEARLGKGSKAWKQLKERIESEGAPIDFVRGRPEESEATREDEDIIGNPVIMGFAPVEEEGIIVSVGPATVFINQDLGISYVPLLHELTEHEVISQLCQELHLDIEGFRTLRKNGYTDVCTNILLSQRCGSWRVSKGRIIRERPSLYPLNPDEAVQLAYDLLVELRSCVNQENRAKVAPILRRQNHELAAEYSHYFDVLFNLLVHSIIVDVLDRVGGKYKREQGLTGGLNQYEQEFLVLLQQEFLDAVEHLGEEQLQLLTVQQFRDAVDNSWTPSKRNKKKRLAADLDRQRYERYFHALTGELVSRQNLHWFSTLVILDIFSRRPLGIRLPPRVACAIAEELRNRAAERRERLRKKAQRKAETPAPRPDDLGAQDLSHGVYLGRLKARLQRLLRGLPGIPEVPADASDREVMGICVDYLASKGLIIETTDIHGNRIRIIDNQTVQALPKRHIARRLVDIMRRRVVIEGSKRGCKAINFRTEDGTWCIVGFQQELGTGEPAGMTEEQEANLLHEQKEIAFRQKGFKPEEAHKKVERGEDPFEGEAEVVEVAEEVQDAQDAELGAAEGTLNVPGSPDYPGYHATYICKAPGGWIQIKVHSNDKPANMFEQFAIFEGGYFRGYYLNPIELEARYPGILGALLQSLSKDAADASDQAERAEFEGALELIKGVRDEHNRHRTEYEKIEAAGGADPSLLEALTEPGTERWYAAVYYFITEVERLHRRSFSIGDFENVEEARAAVIYGRPCLYLSFNPTVRARLLRRLEASSMEAKGQVPEMLHMRPVVLSMTIMVAGYYVDIEGDMSRPRIDHLMMAVGVELPDVTAICELYGYSHDDKSSDIGWSNIAANIRQSLGAPAEKDPERQARLKLSLGELEALISLAADIDNRTGGRLRGRALRNALVIGVLERANLGEETFLGAILNVLRKINSVQNPQPLVERLAQAEEIEDITKTVDDVRVTAHELNGQLDQMIQAAQQGLEGPPPADMGGNFVPMLESGMHINVEFFGAALASLRAAWEDREKGLQYKKAWTTHIDDLIQCALEQKESEREMFRAFMEYLARNNEGLFDAVRAAIRERLRENAEKPNMVDEALDAAERAAAQKSEQPAAPEVSRQEDEQPAVPEVPTAEEEPTEETVAQPEEAVALPERPPVLTEERAGRYISRETGVYHAIAGEQGLNLTSGELESRAGVESRGGILGGINGRNGFGSMAKYVIIVGGERVIPSKVAIGEGRAQRKAFDRAVENVAELFDSAGHRGLIVLSVANIGELNELLSKTSGVSTNNTFIYFDTSDTSEIDRGDVEEFMKGRKEGRYMHASLLGVSEEGGYMPVGGLAALAVAAIALANGQTVNMKYIYQLLAALKYDNPEFQKIYAGQLEEEWIVNGWAENPVEKLFLLGLLEIPVQPLKVRADLGKRYRQEAREANLSRAL